MLFIRFFIWSSVGPPVQRSRTIYAILVEDIMGNIHVKFFKFGPVVQDEMFQKFKHDGRQPDDGHGPITIADLQPLAQVS